MTLKYLSDYGLSAVFFVEPLFSARFGAGRLREIVDLIQDAGQEVQLHLHPEWCDEAPILARKGKASKRPSMWQFERAEQQELIRIGMQMLRDAGVRSLRAFRAGSFAANMDTLRALGPCGLGFDSSCNATSSVSFPDAGPESRVARSSCLGIESYPIGVFLDGFGRMRHAQVGACSFDELRQAIVRSARGGWSDFVILSHGFELLKVGSLDPDPLVVKRFRELCALLRDLQASGLIRVSGFGDVDLTGEPCAAAPTLARVSPSATLLRYMEQARRRIR
jgi:hypothetical protein